MKGTIMVKALSIISACFGLVAFAAKPEIQNVVATQRYPWNGKVDITYTLTGDVTAGFSKEAKIALFVMVSNRVDGTTYVAVASALSGDIGTMEGVHHVIWDLNAQGIELVSDGMIFTVGYVPIMRYCIVDLSCGANTSSYTVSYLADVPSGGFNTDEYKTTKLVLRLIEPGTFNMTQGGTNVPTTITKPFYCGVFEVTQKQYELVTGSNPSFYRGDMRPVEQVSWEMIRGGSSTYNWPASANVKPSSFTGKLQSRTGLNFDFPTEAQWEYACRAGTTSKYNNGGNTDLKQLGRYYGNQSDGKSGYSQHTKVGSYQPNAWGLYDMHGNVCEWCLDRSGALLGGKDPMGPSSGSYYRVLRGGGWSLHADDCTSSSRSGLLPSYEYYPYENGNVGFRLVRTLLNTEDECNLEAVTGAGRVVEICEAEAASAAIDSRACVEPLLDVVILPWNASWIGGDPSATVVITDNGYEMTRTIGVGEFVLPGIGRHEITYTTCIGGVEQDEVYTAVVYVKWKYKVVDGGAIITKTTQTSGTVVIPSEIDGYPVTGIESDVFRDCLGLVNVTIPESVTYIDANAFAGCMGLIYVALPGHFDGNLPDSVFSGCSDSIKKEYSYNYLDIMFDANGGWPGEQVRNIAEGSEIGLLPHAECVGCTFLGWYPSRTGGTKIETTDKVWASNTYFAQWQTNLYTMSFNANGGVGGVTNEQSYASEIVAPEVSREGFTFAGWLPSLPERVLASNMTYMAQWRINQYKIVFDANGGVGSVTNKQDFSSEIVAPVVRRAWHDFVCWTPEVDTTVPAHNVTYTAQWRRWKTSLSDSALDGKTLKKLYPSDYVYLTDVVLEEGVTRLADGFFDGCNEIVRLTLPSTLTAIGYDELPPNIKESLAYDTNGFMIYQGWLLGYRDKEATSLTVPEGVIGIGSCALAEMYDLETVGLPQSLKYIAEGAFREDTYLDNLVIPDGVEIIGDGAFEDCSFIQTMMLGNGIKSVGARAFAGCTQLSGVMFDEGLVEIGAEAFDGCWRMLSVSLPLSVTNVVSTAFRGCTSLTGVTIPTHGGRVSNWFAPIYAQIRDVTLLEDELDICVGMFKGCSSLRSIHLPDSVTNIAAQAFYGCSSLTDVRLPESLLMIGNEAFRNCSSLTAAALPENVTSIGARAFQGCSNLSALTLPRGLEALPDYVFAGCSSLDSFVVPAAVTNLGNYIVSDSTTAIYYLGNAPTYGANVYGNASGSLKSYVILGTKGWDGRPNSRDIPASWNGRDILTWSANQFDVTFDANGGLFFPSVTNTYACEETTYTGYSLPPVEPVRKGVEFDGYWTEPGGGTRVFTSTRVLLTKPHTLYAHWKKGTTIKVRFNACGGTVSPAEDDYVSERPYCELPVPVREHFAFEGWWTEASDGSRVEISTEVPKAAHELFAHWTPNRYTIRFHANNETDMTGDQSFTYGDTVTLDANSFTRDGYAFVGWALSESGPAVYADCKTLGDFTAVQDNVIHLYAVWVSTRYTVRFDSHGGVGRMENQTFVKDTAASLNGCSFTRTGYTFAGWAISITGGVVYGDGENVVNVYERTRSDVVLYAVWVPIVYSVHYSANGGTGTMVDQQMTYDEPAPLSTSRFTMPGSLFRGWATVVGGSVSYNEQSNVKNLSSVADDIVTLYAVWQEKPVSLLTCEVVFDGVGTVLLDENDSIIVTLTNDVNSTVEIPDNVGAVTIDLNGHDMVGDGGPAIRIVQGDGEGTTTRLAIVDTSDGEKGLVAGSGESAGIKIADGVTVGVRLDVDGSVSVLNGDGTEQDWRELLLVRVMFDANGGSVSPMMLTVMGGTEVGTLPTPARDGYTFDGWFTAASGGMQVTSSTKITANVTYYAHWTANGGSSGGGDTPTTGPMPTPVPEVVFAGTVSDTSFRSKAQTAVGALYASSGHLVGTMQVKFGKVSKKGIVKISGNATLLVDGKAKKVSAKAVKVELNATGRVPPVTLAFKVPVGEMSFEMAADGTFTLKNGNYSMAEKNVGGNWSKAGARVYVAATGAALPDGTIEDLLPDGEMVIPKGGKWSFAKAAGVKYAKDKKTKESSLVIDTKKGTNRSAMKLSYTPKTGIFKGSFKVYAIQGGKLKKFTVKVIGVVVDGKGAGDAFGPNGLRFDVTVE